MARASVCAAFARARARTQPWDFSHTGTTVTLTWTGFAVLLVLTCLVGIASGWCLKKYRGRAGGDAAFLEVSTDAHDLY